jgi:hypothetical protein
MIDAQRENDGREDDRGQKREARPVHGTSIAVRGRNYVSFGIAEQDQQLGLVNFGLARLNRNEFATGKACWNY